MKLINRITKLSKGVVNFLFYKIPVLTSYSIILAFIFSVGIGVQVMLGTQSLIVPIIMLAATIRTVQKPWKVFNYITCALIFSFGVFLLIYSRNQEIKYIETVDKYTTSLTKDSNVVVELEYAVVIYDVKGQKFDSLDNFKLYDAYIVDIFGDTDSRNSYLRSDIDTNYIRSNGFVRK